MRSKWTLILSIGGLILIGLNYFFLDPFVTDSYQNGNAFVDYFYPRFSIEKHQLPLGFFMEKKDQVIYNIK